MALVQVSHSNIDNKDSEIKPQQLIHPVVNNKINV